VSVGERLDDGVIVYRAFAEKNFRDRKKNKVRYFAYLLREEDVENGLSVGLTPAASARYLETNEGYCEIRVGTIHALGHNLEVRADTEDPEHAYICGLPLRTISDISLENARLIGGKLADGSQCVTCDPYVPDTATQAAAATPPEDIP
jgi:hypothetical protein